MFKSLSTSLIARGILAVVVGIIALAWPSVTVLALVILFAVHAFIAAGLQAVRAFSSRTAGPVIGHLLLGLVDLAAGVIALAWPGPTALVLVLIVGVWAIQREICGGSVQKKDLSLAPAVDVDSGENGARRPRFQGGSPGRKTCSGAPGPCPILGAEWERRHAVRYDHERSPCPARCL
jgi:Short repeat of unknown function (DUF308)